MALNHTEPVLYKATLNCGCATLGRGGLWHSCLHRCGLRVRGNCPACSKWGKPTVRKGELFGYQMELEE